jgi:hypothetical protein
MLSNTTANFRYMRIALEDEDVAGLCYKIIALHEQLSSRAFAVVRNSALD